MQSRLKKRKDQPSREIWRNKIVTRHKSLSCFLIDLKLSVAMEPSGSASYGKTYFKVKESWQKVLKRSY